MRDKGNVSDHSTMVETLKNEKLKADRVNDIQELQNASSF